MTLQKHPMWFKNHCRVLTNMELLHLRLWAQSARKKWGPHDEQNRQGVRHFPRAGALSGEAGREEQTWLQERLLQLLTALDCGVNKSYPRRLVEKRQVNNRKQFSKYIGSQTIDDNRRNESNMFQMWYDGNLTLER